MTEGKKAVDKDRMIDAAKARHTSMDALLAVLKDKGSGTADVPVLDYTQKKLISECSDSDLKTLISELGSVSNENEEAQTIKNLLEVDVECLSTLLPTWVGPNLQTIDSWVAKLWMVTEGPKSVICEEADGFQWLEAFTLLGSLSNLSE